MRILLGTHVVGVAKFGSSVDFTLLGLGHLIRFRSIPFKRILRPKLALQHGRVFDLDRVYRQAS